jgi:hypothetical protein
MNFEYFKRLSIFLYKKFKITNFHKKYNYCKKCQGILLKKCNIKMISMYNKLCNNQDEFFLTSHICTKDKDH